MIRASEYHATPELIFLAQCKVCLGAALSTTSVTSLVRVEEKLKGQTCNNKCRKKSGNIGNQIKENQINLSQKQVRA